MDTHVRAGFKIKLSFHIAHHSFADITRKEAIDIHSLSKLLGHSSIKTTQTYLAAFDKESQDSIMEKVIPLFISTFSLI